MLGAVGSGGLCLPSQLSATVSSLSSPFPSASSTMDGRSESDNKRSSAWLDVLVLAGSADVLGLVARVGALGAWVTGDINIRYGVESHFERESCSEAQKQRLCTLLVANTRLRRADVVWCSSNRPIHEMDTNMPNWTSNSYTITN
jgi:hypothetical protein